MQPIAVDANLPETFYRGSGRLASFRGADLPSRPEDWVASTTARFEQAPAGLSRLPDGRLLRDAIAAAPLDWLGAEHVARHGADPALLVKLLDAGQRLPVHVHPSRSFAHEHLDNPHGKTEAWIVLDAAPGAAVRLGFNRDVSAAELARWVSAQDVSALAAATNAVPIRAGDALLCPAGLPHAIDADVLLVELQEPTDFSVLLEWSGFPLQADDAFVGLPMDVALDCVDRDRCSPERLAELRGTPERVLPAEADAFFTARRLTDGAEVQGYAVLVGVDGTGSLAGDWGSVPIGRGTTLVLPFAAGNCTLSGDVQVIACGPPLLPDLDATGQV